MSKFRFDRKAMNFRSKKSRLLERMANNAVNHFKVEVFDSRSFDGKSWAPNNVQDGRQQLVKTGRLRQGYKIAGRTQNSIKVINDVPYAVYHNEGTKHLPKRQLIGETRKLRATNTKLIDNYLRTSGKQI